MTNLHVEHVASDMYRSRHRVHVRLPCKSRQASAASSANTVYLRQYRLAWQLDMPLARDNHSLHAKAIPDPTPTNKDVLQVGIPAVLQH